MEMIQIDMPMPTNCFDCLACNEYLMCAIPVNGRKWGENDVCEFEQGRPEWCPLKEQEAVVAHWDDDTGHWIEGDRNGIDTHARTTGEMIDTFRCSWCGFYQYWKTPFCPNCGAKMERSVKWDA